MTLYGVDLQRIQDLAIHLRIAVPADAKRAISDLLDRAQRNEHFILDLVEAMLERFGWDRGRAIELQKLLDDANSAYRVKDSWDGLEDRVVPGVKESVRKTIEEASGSAGDHLTNAWNAAYGRSPDPVKAYSEAIKAVEAALAPHVSPQNAKQTLGTMIGDIKAKPSKWTFSLTGGVAGVEVVLGMMRVLWDGQTSRHGGLTATRPETQGEARAAIHLAATLVQLGTSGAFRAAAT